MHVAFIAPRLRFEPDDNYWREHESLNAEQFYVKELAKALSIQGHEVDIIIQQVGDPSTPEFAGAEEEYPGFIGVRILRLPFGRERLLPKEEVWPHLAQELVQAIVEIYRRDGKFPDVFAAQFADGGLTAAILKDRQHLGKIPYTFTAYGLAGPLMDRLCVTYDNISQMDEEFRLTSRVMAERVSMNHASKIIVQSSIERFKQYSHRVYAGAIDPREGGKFVLIPPGINFSIFGHDTTLPIDDDIATRINDMFDRDLYPHRLQAHNIVAVSRLTHEDNLRTLVEAYGRNEEIQELANLILVVPNLPDPLRDLSGATREETEVMQDILNLMNHYSLHGHVSIFNLQEEAEISSFLRNMAARRSILVHPRLYENTGLLPLEAMAAGLPVICTNRGIPTELLFNGEINKSYGVLVNPQDVGEISEAMTYLLASHDTWNYYRGAGIQRVRESYTTRHIAEMYTDVFNDIIARKDQEPQSTEEIPGFFTSTLKVHDVSVDRLADLYFGKVGVVAGHHGEMVW